MDVDAMYPNLDARKVAKVVAQEFLHSDLKIEVDPKELGLYLAIAYQGARRQELVALGLDAVVQRRRHPRARPILITTGEVLTRGESGYREAESKFLEPERLPTEQEVREMMGLALEEAVKACMTHHVYSLAGQTLLQSKGGPIGLKLSGAAAKVYMVWWSREFSRAVEAATRDIPGFMLYLHRFYVDDHNLVTEELPPGSRLVEGKVRVVQEEVEGDRLLPGDQRTALVLKEVANSVCPFTSLTADYPSAHASGWMPLLDIEVRMREDGSVDWRFYKKPMASQYCILNRSAVPGGVKRAALAQEGLRRLRNTRPDRVEAAKAGLMEDLAEMMRCSGYPEDYRAGVLHAALTGYNKQVAADSSGEKPLYRPREWREADRRRQKKLSKAAWFRPADTVLFVPPTPNSELAAMARTVVQEEGSRLGISVRVVETAGVSLRQQLVRTDLGAGDPCPQEDCQLCATDPGSGGLSHHRSGALYTGTCRICPQEQGEGFTALYTGESGYSAYTRTQEHANSIRRRDEENAFAKHLAEHHPDQAGQEGHFNFKLEKTFTKPMPRQVTEAVRIHSSEADIVLNSRSEWEQPVTDRVVVTRNLPERGEGRGQGRIGRSQGGGV